MVSYLQKPTSTGIIIWIKWLNFMYVCLLLCAAWSRTFISYGQCVCHWHHASFMYCIWNQCTGRYTNESVCFHREYLYHREHCVRCSYQMWIAASSGMQMKLRQWGRLAPSWVTEIAQMRILLNSYVLWYCDSLNRMQCNYRFNPDLIIIQWIPEENMPQDMNASAQSLHNFKLWISHG